MKLGVDTAENEPKGKSDVVLPRRADLLLLLVLKLDVAAVGLKAQKKLKKQSAKKHRRNVLTGKNNVN